MKTFASGALSGPLGLLGAVLLACPASAQRAAPHLGTAAAAEVAKLYHDAEAEHLPVTPLRGKVDEGLSKGATDERILMVVRAYVAALRAARTALVSADSVDLDAGAAALRAGAKPALLTQLRATRGQGPIATPLVVYVDLVTRGIPADSVGSGLLRLMEGGASDRDLLDVQGQIARQSVQGTDPMSALRAAIRARPMSGAARPGGLPGGGGQ